MLADDDGLGPEAVVTFDRPDGFDVLRSFGSVRGEAVIARNVFRSTMRTIGTIVGLGVANYLTDAERARTSALQALLRNARALGANGIVKFRFDASELGDGSTRVDAHGEALLLAPAPGRAHKRSGAAGRSGRPR